MTVITADDIARRAGGEVTGDPAAMVDSWAFDSRVLDPGACFVALRGTRDGHDFVSSAFAAGATVALVDHAPDRVTLGAGRALVRVDDTLEALQQVAHSLRTERRELAVVAIGGSTGKTSTKDLVAAALAPLGCHANAESYNNEFGLPLTFCNTPAVARVVVAEMGERFAGDLALLCDIAQPNVGVVTNVGIAHAEFLGGPAGTIAVLAELLEALPSDGLAVLNADDRATPELAEHTRARVVTAGSATGADYRIDDVDLDAHLRSSFTLRRQRFSVRLHGRHQAQNASLAIAAAHERFGMPLSEIAVALEAAQPARLRMQLLETDDGITILNDAYNANPTSMEAALHALAHFDVGPGSRRIAVLGEMRELGDFHAAAHHAAGEQAAQLRIDLLVGVGDGGALIAAAAHSGGLETTRAADAAAASALVAGLARRGDAVLVKASNAVALEQVADALLAQGRARCGSAGSA